MFKKHIKPGIAYGSGFTLIELAIIIVILGVIATVGIPVMGNMINASKVSATENELYTLKIALVGKTGDGGIRGYENDVGALPPTLQGLFIKPAGVSDWNRFTKIGWNGPYIDGDNGEYMKDAWGAIYVYDSAGRTIKSVGGRDTITVAF
ncbi:MAG: type II secretion system protein GspG [Candidatus Zixiibacteriota bacterium]|nr:MAG: type II secretion system protein GspG [candidate division Zixibacteria bacterium]